MVKQYKIDFVNELKEKLNSKKNIILTNYSGIKVKDLYQLRKILRDKGAEYKVIKNNLFRKALKDGGYPPIDTHLVGPIGVVFVDKELSEIAKVLKDFQKEQDKFQFSVAIMDNVVYSQKDVQRIAELPPIEVLLSQVMSLINGPATGTAIAINQVMASLARGIKLVAQQNA